MAWVELAVRAVHDLAWPLAAVWLGWYFRDTIVAQLPRVTKVGPVTLDLPSPQQGKPPVIDDKNIRKVESYVPPELLEEARLEIENKFPRDSHNVDDLQTLSAALLVSGMFERTYNLIFGSQLFLPGRLNIAPVPLNDAREIYERAKEAFPLFYKNYTFENWINFLVAFKLADRKDEETLVISPRGRGFLRYLVENGYSTLKPT